MKPINCRRVTYWVAPLVGVVLGCQLIDGNPERSKSTSASRPAPVSRPAPLEPAPVVENTTAAASEEDPNVPPVPCAATEFNYPVVKAACDEGGRKAVKKVMQGAIAKAKHAGTELKCSNCHVDQKTFGLRPNAVDDLKNWL